MSTFSLVSQLRLNFKVHCSLHNNIPISDILYIFAYYVKKKKLEKRKRQEKMEKRKETTCLIIPRCNVAD